MVVVFGDTVAEPVGASSAPTLLSMLTEVAFVVVHDNVALPPGPIDAGDAVNVIVGAEAATATVTLCVVVPPAPVAVAVNVVVVFTTTAVDPESANSVWSSPRMLGLTVKLLALVVVHVSVTSEPAVTDEALVVNVMLGAAALTFTSTVWVVLPPVPLAVAVKVVSAFTVTFTDPERGSALLLIEGVMVTEVAFVADQVSVTWPPAVTLVVSAEKVRLGTGGGGAVELELPPQPMRIARAERTTRETAERSRRSNTETPQARVRAASLDSATPILSCSCFNQSHELFFGRR